MVALGSCALHARPVISSGRGAVVLFLELLLLLSLIQCRPINDMDEVQRSHRHPKRHFTSKHRRHVSSIVTQSNRDVFMCHIKVEKLLIVRMNDSSRLARHGQFLDLGLPGLGFFISPKPLNLAP